MAVLGKGVTGTKEQRCSPNPFVCVCVCFSVAPLRAGVSLLQNEGLVRPGFLGTFRPSSFGFLDPGVGHIFYFHADVPHLDLPGCSPLPHSASLLMPYSHVSDHFCSAVQMPQTLPCFYVI